jgi:hypothetical protein
VVTGEVVNQGPAAARNAVVVLSAGGGGRAGTARAAASSPVTVVAPESSVGDLEPGESQPVRFRVAVSEDADPGSHTFTGFVQYENAAGDLRQSSSPLRRSLQVGPERDAITIRNVSSTVTAGGEGLLRVTVENTGARPITDANAKLFVNDPLSSSDNSAFLGRLEPGETKTAVFKISASGEAVAKRYAGTVEVRYDDADGDTELTDGLQVGVPVQAGDGGLPIPFITAGAGVLVVSGLVFARQRRAPGSP